MSEFLIGLFFAFGSGIVTAIKSIQFVQEGERGALLRFGKFRRVVEPGFVLTIPFIHALPRVHIRQNTAELQRQTVTLKDRTTFQIQTVVVFKVVDTYNALFVVSGLTESVKNLGLAVLREEMAKCEYKDTADLEKINILLAEHLKIVTKGWGIEIEGFKITEFAPTPETSHYLLQERNATAQTKVFDVIAKHLASQQDVVAKLKEAGVTQQLLGALLLRGAGGTATVEIAQMADEDKKQNKNRPSEHEGLLF